VKTDLDDPKFANFYWTNHSDARLQEFLQDWVLKSMELIDQYQPDIFWYDNGIDARDYDPLKLKVAAYYYNRALQWHKPVTFLTKDSAFLAGSVLEFEKLNPRGPTQILKGIWDAEEPIGSTWGYSTANPVETFRGARSVINELCIILSMNGNLLLNLSPTGTGAINDQQRTALKEVGKWLAVNGEAVYGTHNWIVDGEGFTPLPPRSPQMRRPEAAAAAAMEQGPTAGVAAPATATPRPPRPPRPPDADVSAQGPKPVEYRFTVKGDNLYAIAQSWPGDTALITSLAKGKALDGQLAQGKIKSVTLLGHPGKLKFALDADGLKVKLPADKPCDYAWTLKITGLKMNPAGPPVPAVMADLR
jgi:alpha-L-fucosidase